MQFEILTETSLAATWEQQIRSLFGQLNAHMTQLPVPSLLKGQNPPTIVVCREGERLLGMGTLCTYQVISGHKAWVEDVVVDKDARGRGIGRQLMQQLIDNAREKGAREILLFTGHHRLPAIGLYRSLGFEEKQSSLMRMSLK